VSVELIVLRAFMGDQAVAKELLAHGFTPELMPTGEGREVAQTVLALRTGATAPTLEDLRHALEARQARHAVPAHLRRYLETLAMMPCCSSLHAVAHLQMLQLDVAMARVDQVSQRVSQRVGVLGGGEGGAEKPETVAGASVEPGPTQPAKGGALCRHGD
jgi:hypothetical protein